MPSAAGLDVVTSFYPLQFVAEQVGGARVNVSNLTPPGAEPHDVELSPRTVAKIEDADLAVYLKGFSPAVDEAIAEHASANAFDVTVDADLVPAPDGSGDHATDPHFWLDPIRLAAVADGLAYRLGDLDPPGRATFLANAAALRERLAALDGELAHGLAACQNRYLVTSHAAFGYLATHYGLVQRAITGLGAEGEPTPESLASAAEFVRANDVRTIYHETLVSPAVARTIARETGARTAVLDPLEGLGDAGPGADYFTVMRANLATLREGQPCP